MTAPPMAGQMADSAPPEEAGEPTGNESQEKTSVFIPKDALGDRQCKPGEKLTLTVNDVDQDTGEVEATVDGYEGGSGTGGNTSKAIDSMPES